MADLSARATIPLWACFALPLSACSSEVSPFVSLPPLDGLSSVLYIVEAPGEEPKAHGGSLEDPRLIPVMETEGTELYALGFECPRLESMGFHKVGEEWRMPAGARVRAPGGVLRTVVRGNSAESWESLDEVPEPILSSVGYAFSSTTPCMILEGEPTTLGFEGRAQLVGLESGELLVFRPGGNIDQIDPSGGVRHISTPTTAPTNTPFLSANGELWIYGQEGRLWHTEVLELLGDAPLWEEAPANPAWKACENQTYAVDADPEDTRALFVMSKWGGIDRFDLASGTWSVILPPLPPLPGTEEDPIPPCPQLKTNLEWKPPNQIVAVRFPQEEVVDYDPVHGVRISRPSVDGIDVGAPLIVTEAPGLGTVVGTNANKLLRRVGEAGWAVLVDLPGTFEVTYFRSLISIGDGRVLWSGRDGLRMFDREYGLCQTRLFDGATMERLVQMPSEPRDYYASAIAVSSGVWRLHPLPFDPCRADPE